MVTIIIRWLVELVYQPEKRFGSDIITVIIVVRLWLVCKTVPAAQHRVATDAPAGAFKIGPISWESLCHLSCFSSPGARLNANRWASQPIKSRLHTYLDSGTIRVSIRIIAWREYAKKTYYYH